MIKAMKISIKNDKNCEYFHKNDKSYENFHKK
jgi:hypothetical protein